MLAVISSDEDPVTRSDTVAADHMPWIIAPNDKHIAQRNLHVITAPAPKPEPIKTLIDFHNSFEFPQYFDIVIDKRMLPKGSKLSILLPKVETRIPLTQILGKGIEITTLSSKEWWGDKVKGISNKNLKYHCTVKGGIIDHSHDDGIEVIPDILIPARNKIQATLIVSPPPKAKAGSSYRFVIMQRQKKMMMLIGGSTYEIRIPAAVVRRKVSSK
jgi:hypothetical protein